MSPKNLDKLASQIDARAGMEFEMIVPNVDNVDLEPEYERDEDADRRARSFDDVEEFFNDGDYNSSRDVRRLIGELQEAYMEWKIERTSDDWIDQGKDYIRDYIANNDLFDRDDALVVARDSVMDAFPDLDPNGEEFQQLVSDRITELEDEFVISEFEGQGRIYNDAFTEFADEMNETYDENDFLEEELSYMSDIERNYDIQWPYYIDINQNQSGEVDIDRVADEFSSAIGRPVNASSRYHGATREKGKYVVEPDGSLEPDDSDDSGLEFVSPPLPLEEMFSDLDKVKKWADEKGCYTNSSTGLHINVSVPEFSVDNLDYIKLALLMGDKYVLEQFDRLGNTYAKSAMDKIVERIKQRPEDAEMLLVKMKEGLGKLATKVIHSGATDKYTSINTKKGYIEFRSPGGDWLSDKFFNQIKPTLSRFVVALDAAMDPEKYRDEYLKKLYKLLQPKSKEDTLSYFAKYAAGELPKAALKSFIKQAQLERKVAKDPTGGEQYWWRVGRPGYGATVEVVATNKADAIALGKKEYPEWEYARDMTATPIRAYDKGSTPAGGAGTSQTDNQGNWGVWVPSLDRWATIGNAGPRRFSDQSGAEAWIQDYNTRHSGNDLELDAREIEPAAAPANRNTLAPTGPGPWEVFRRSDGRSVAELGTSNRMAAEVEARSVIDQRREAPELYGVRTVSTPVPGSTLDLARQRAASQYTSTPIPGVQDVELDIPLAPRTLTRPGQGQQTFTGNWLILDPEGREIHRFGGIGNVQSDANRVAINWLRARPGTMQAGVTVVPEMN
jgi:hypothetical protein